MTGSAVTVRVPATSANLGPGFDSFGLALARFDEVTAARTGGGLRVEVHGAGAGEVPLTHQHLVVRAIAKAFVAVGEPLPGLQLRCSNCIPHGGGLGSSASAIVAGLLLGRELLADLMHGSLVQVGPWSLGVLQVEASRFVGTRRRSSRRRGVSRPASRRRSR